MARRAKVDISSPRGTCVRDEIPRGFHPNFMKECIEMELFYDDGKDTQDEPELEVGDMLDSWNRKMLVEVIMLNKLPIQVMRSWTDGQVRQAIRDIVPAEDFGKLMTQPARSAEVDLASGITSDKRNVQ